MTIPRTSGFSGKWGNIRKNFLIRNCICRQLNAFSFEHQLCLGLCWISLENYSKCHHGLEISEWNNFRFWIFMPDVTKAHGQARSTSFGDNLPSVFRKWRYYCWHISCEKYWVTWYWYTSNFEYFITLFQYQSYSVNKPRSSQGPFNTSNMPALSGGVLFEDTWYSLVVQSNISSSRQSVDRPPYPYTRLPREWPTENLKYLQMYRYRLMTSTYRVVYSSRTYNGAAWSRFHPRTEDTEYSGDSSTMGRVSNSGLFHYPRFVKFTFPLDSGLIACSRYLFKSWHRK